jgi:hypothetical protein
METDLGDDGANLRRFALAFDGPGIDPKSVVRLIGVNERAAKNLNSGHDFFLSLIDLSGQVAMEACAVRRLEARERGLPFVPRGFGAEEDAVPVVVGKSFPIVIPDGVELAGGPELLTLRGELLDVCKALVVVGIDARPVIDAGGDPGLDMSVGKRSDEAREAFRMGLVLPGNRDGVLFEVIGELLQEGGIVHGNVSPEEQLALEGLEVSHDLLQIIEVDGPGTAGVHLRLGPAPPKVGRFIRSYVKKGAGINAGHLSEHLVGKLQGAWLARREDVTVRGFGEGRVLFPVEQVVKMAE